MKDKEQATLSIETGSNKGQWDEVAWLTSKEPELVDKSVFTREVARCWNESSFSTKFSQFHPNWQRVLLTFARKVNALKLQEK